MSASCAITFFLLMWWALFWGTESANPCRPLEETIEGCLSPLEAVAVIAVQVIGSLLAFSYIQSFWEMELVEAHTGRELANCMVDLKVSLVRGFFIEFTGTCIKRMVAKTLNDTHNMIAAVLQTLCTIALVIAGADFTGGYYNPAVATSMKFGCNPNELDKLVFVYWIGPLVGSAVSVQLMSVVAPGKSASSVCYFPEKIRYGLFM